ncbi:zinc-ribbon domain-containing protein [Ruminococcus sp.]
MSPSEVRPYSTQKVWWIDDDGNEYQRRIDSEVMMYRKNHPDTASV